MLEHQGRYRCEISCNNERTWSNEVDILVGMAAQKYLSAWFKVINKAYLDYYSIALPSTL